MRNPLRSSSVRRSAIALFLFGVFFTSALPAMARTYKTNRRVGQTRYYTIRRQLDRRPNVRVENGSIVRAWFNWSQKRLYITGLRRGKTRVHFTGFYRRYQAGINVPLAHPQAFHDVVEVTVYGNVAIARPNVNVPRPNPTVRPTYNPPARSRSRIISLTLRPGQSRTWAMKVFLGQQYRNRRGLRLNGPRIVSARLGRRSSGETITLTGRQRGTTRIIIQCERWDYNTRQWIRFTCTLKIRVHGATYRANNSTRFRNG